MVLSGTVAAQLVSGFVLLFVLLMHIWNSDESVWGMNTRSHTNGSKTQDRPDLRAGISPNVFPVILIGVVLGAFVFRDERYFRFLWSMHAYGTQFSDNCWDSLSNSDTATVHES